MTSPSKSGRRSDFDVARLIGVSSTAATVGHDCATTLMPRSSRTINNRGEEDAALVLDGESQLHDGQFHKPPEVGAASEAQ